MFFSYFISYLTLKTEFKLATVASHVNQSEDDDFCLDAFCSSSLVIWIISNAEGDKVCCWDSLLITSLAMSVTSDAGKYGIKIDQVICL